MSGKRKTVLIGGLNGGIGSEVARRLVNGGWNVCGFVRGEEAVAKMEKSFPEVRVLNMDCTDPESVERKIPEFIDQSGPVHAYVHAVGSVFLKPLHLTSAREFSEVLETNLISAFLVVKEVVKAMRKGEGGSIVLFGSVAGVAGLANHEAIAAAKGGIMSMARSIAATYASAGIRANAIAPGLVETHATAGLLSNEQARRLSERMHPLGRIGSSREVASLVEWLVSDDASWTTGQVFSIDGGMGSIVPKPRA